MVSQLRDRLVLAEIALLRRAWAAARRVREVAARAARGERGQTPTEYLMIVGLMAVVIVIVFVTFYWTEVKDAAKKWVDNVKQSILGTSITP